MKLARLILLASIGVVMFDVIAALAAMIFNVPYTSFIIGSYLIYATVGYLAANAKSLPYSILVGGLVGMVDATIGWAISWRMGPGKLNDLSDSATIASMAGVITEIVVTIFLVTIIAAIIGLLGGLTWKLRSRLMQTNA